MPGAPLAMNKNSTPHPFNFGDLRDAFARAYTLAAALENRQFELHLAQCSDDDEKLIIEVLSLSDRDGLTTEFQWAARWYRALLDMFALSWNMTSSQVHQRVTAGWTCDCEVDDEPPYAEDDDAF